MEAHKCQNCDMIFVHPAPTFSPGKIYSRNYFEDNYIAFESIRLTYFHKLADILFGFLTTPDTLLDVGCGVGYFAEVMRTRGWQVQGVEPADFARQYAKTKFRVNVYERMNMLGSQRFSAITFLDVLAHVHDPHTLFRAAIERLSSSGYVVIKTPSHPELLFKALSIVSPLIATRGLLHIPAQLSHFNASALKWLLAESNIDVVESGRIEELSLPVSWRRHAKAALYNKLILKVLGMAGIKTSLLVIGYKR